MGTIAHENGGHAEFTYLIPQKLLVNYAKCENEVSKKNKPTSLPNNKFQELNAHSEIFSRMVKVKAGLSTFDQEKTHLRSYKPHDLLGLLFDAYDIVPSNRMMSWLTTPIIPRREDRRSSRRSMPSIRISPDVGS